MNIDNRPTYYKELLKSEIRDPHDRLLQVLPFYHPGRIDKYRKYDGLLFNCHLWIVYYDIIQDAEEFLEEFFPKAFRYNHMDNDMGWDSYDDETTMIIDNFQGSSTIRYTDIILLFLGWGFVPKRRSNNNLFLHCIKHIIIKSPIHPEEWYNVPWFRIHRAVNCIYHIKKDNTNSDHVTIDVYDKYHKFIEYTTSSKVPK